LPDKSFRIACGFERSEFDEVTAKSARIVEFPRGFAYAALRP